MGMLLEELLWELDWQATSPPMASISNMLDTGLNACFFKILCIIDSLYQ